MNTPKLTAAQHAEIRAAMRLRRQLTSTALAAKYGVSKNTLARIAYGRPYRLHRRAK